MTTEEKVRAYDEALEKAQYWLNAPQVIKDWNYTIKDIIPNIFPELKKSEDERIREELIGHCKDLVRMNQDDKVMLSVYEPWLAWLEKQKAKERLDRMAPIYNDKESFEFALEKAWKYYNESSSRIVDSFEDDYIECVFSKGFREGFLYREKQKEQKPNKQELNEEDEEMLQLLISYFGAPHLIPMKINTSDKVIDFKDMASWLKNRFKSLRPQSKQQGWRHYTWHNQMRFDYDALVKYENGLGYEIVISGNKPAKEVNGEYIFLKDICSQPHWKPSKEQMRYLKKVYESYYFCDGERTALESLYNDLEKLL